MSSSSRLPRSLRLPKRDLGRKGRVTAERRRTTGRLLARYRTDDEMQLGRQTNALRSLFAVVGESDPVEWLKQKVNEKQNSVETEKCVVLDIGSRNGLALQSLAIASGFTQPSTGVKFVGIDVFPASKGPIKNIHLVRGNILTKSFPKSDLVFSMVVLGYAGNVGFVVKKAGNALKPGGMAALQVNKKGRAQFSDPARGIAEGQMITLIQDMPKLARQLQGMRLPNCTIQVFTPNGWGGNLAVLIKKK